MKPGDKVTLLELLAQLLKYITVGLNYQNILDLGVIGGRLILNYTLKPCLMKLLSLV